MAVVLFFPFYADFEPPASGLGLVPIRSRLDQFVVFWGLLLVPSLAFLATVFPWRVLGLTRSAFTSAKQAAEPAPATGWGRASGAIWVAVFVLTAALATVRGNGVLAVSFLLGLAAAWAIWAQRERPAVVFGLVLLGLAAALIGACEVIYIQDFYGAALRRMNTVFKLYYQAWTLLALVGAFGTYVVGSGLWQAVRSRRPAAPGLAAGAAVVGVVLVALGLVYPAVTMTQRTDGFRKTPTLDGVCVPGATAAGGLSGSPMAHCERAGSSGRAGGGGWTVQPLCAYCHPDWSTYCAGVAAARTPLAW